MLQKKERRRERKVTEAIQQGEDKTEKERRKYTEGGKVNKVQPSEKKKRSFRDKRGEEIYTQNR